MLFRSNQALQGADVVMALRVQKERLAGRHHSVEDYISNYQVTPQRMKLAKPDAILMHPGPVIRGMELTSEVADGPQSVIHEQVRNGVKTRMAILAMVLGACSATKDFSAEHAFDMPSPTEKGYAALAAGDNPTAVKWLTIAAQDKPGDPYLTLDLAAAYQRLGRFDEARKLYQGVVDTAAGIVPEKIADAKLQGRDLAQIAAADLAICSACALPDPAIKAYQAFAAGDFAAAAGQFEAAAAESIGVDNLYLQLDQAATDLIESTVLAHGGNVAAAARALKVSRSTIYSHWRRTQRFS